jgi:hypothetical protein
LATTPCRVASACHHVSNASASRGGVQTTRATAQASTRARRIRVMPVDTPFPLMFPGCKVPASELVRQKELSAGGVATEPGGHRVKGITRAKVRASIIVGRVGPRECKARLNQVG